MALKPSNRLQRAADAELRRLGRRLAVVEQRHADAKARALIAESKVQEVRAAIRLVEAAVGIAEAASVLRAGGTVTRLPPPPTAIGGKALVREAVQHVLPGEAINYMKWFERITAAGVLVSGVEPPNAFLTNITRCPLVVRSSKRGVYSVEPERADELRRKYERQTRTVYALTELPKPGTDAWKELMALRRQAGEARELAPLVGRKVMDMIELPDLQRPIRGGLIS